MMVRGVSAAVLLLLCVVPSAWPHEGQKETEEHGARAPHEKFHDKHYKDGEHDPHMDHQAVIGSRKEAETFDSLDASESKAKLEKMVRTKIDKDGDGFVTKEELSAWIEHNMVALDDEETDERFEETDMDKDYAVTFAEYRAEAFGDDDEPLDEEDRALLEEDERYFKAADVNGDGKLSREEYRAFQAPENHPHMHDTLVTITLAEKDKDKDGKLSFAEYLDAHGESFKEEGNEYYDVEKDRFYSEFDKDGDGKLDREEIKTWLVPNIGDTARDEVKHLMEKTDADQDGKLSVAEITAEHDLWVGSEATNYGDHLRDEL